jgi:hypothetical protein
MKYVEKFVDCPAICVNEFFAHLEHYGKNHSHTIANHWIQVNPG